MAVDGAPLRDDAPDTYIPTDVRYTEGGIAEGEQVHFDFGSVTFTKPGIYVYNITENIPTEGKIPGVSYDSSFYRVTVTITDDGSGKLKMETPVIVHVFGDDTTDENPQIATFTNTFKDDTETLNIEAKKDYKDNQGETMALAYGQFNFKLEPANAQGVPQANDTTTPMPSNAVNGVASTVNNADGVITFADITYTLSANGGKTYY